MRFCVYLERELSNQNVFIIKVEEKMKHVPCTLSLSVSLTVFEIKKSDRSRQDCCVTYIGVAKRFEACSIDRQPMAVRGCVRCAWEQGTSPLSMPSGVAV